MREHSGRYRPSSELYHLYPRQDRKPPEKSIFGIPQLRRALIVAEVLLIVGTLTFLVLQIWVERDNAKKELRAYLRLEVAGSIQTKFGRIDAVPIRIVNSGATPAYSVAVSVRSFIESPSGGERWPWNFEPRRFVDDKIGYLPEVAFRRYPTDYVIEKEKLVRGELHLFIVGIVYYADIYGEKHWATFCMWWSRENLTAEKATYCNNFNETDETRPDFPKDGPIVIRPS